MKTEEQGISIEVEKVLIELGFKLISRNILSKIYSTSDSKYMVCLSNFCKDYSLNEVKTILEKSGISLSSVNFEILERHILLITSKSNIQNPPDDSFNFPRRT